MINDLDKTDILLLNSNPQKLIIKHQILISNIVKKYIRSGHFKYEELNEIIQHVNERLLQLMPKICSQFEGKSLVITYLSSIIRNICNEIIRKQTTLKVIHYFDDDIRDNSDTAENTLLIEDEMTRLKVAIELYHKQKHKLLLCLKVLFKMPYDFEDFTNVHNDFVQSEFDSFNFNIQPYNDSSDKSVYSALTNFFNKYENKDNTPDALRKWINIKVFELIEILNGNIPRSTYSRETFQILFEKCYFCKEKSTSKNILIIESINE